MNTLAIITAYLISGLFPLAYVLFVYLDGRKLQQLKQVMEEKQSES